MLFSMMGLVAKSSSSIISFFPDKVPAEIPPYVADMKVRHLLAMASGHAKETGPALFAGGHDLVRTFLSIPPDQEPGTLFCYNQGCTYTLSAIITKLTGQRLVDYLGPRLFDPLGIDQTYWTQADEGIDLGFTGLHVTTETIAKLGIPTMIGGTDPSLTRVNNRWLFRCRPNDLYSSRVIADFGVNSLKLKKWAVVHSTDAFGSGGSKALTDALMAYSVEPVLVQGYTNNSQDFTPVVLAIKKSGADIIGTYMTNSQDLGIFAKQLRQLGVNATWVGSASIVTDTAMKLAGEALYGTYGVADFNPDANDEAKAFSKMYRTKYKLEPDVYSSWAFDAMNVIATALNGAKDTKPENIRNGIVGLKNWKGVEGIYNFDEAGDGLRGYNIVKNDNGKVAFVKHINFEK